jgi:uncharacterized integral membrane protein
VRPRAPIARKEMDHGRRVWSRPGILRAVAATVTGILLARVARFVVSTSLTQHMIQLLTDRNSSRGGS